MQQALQVTFRGLPPSAAVEADIREKAAKLEEFCPRVTSCRVVVEAEHHRHHQGNLYHVRIDVGVPRKHIIISHEHHDDHSREDLYVVIRDSFAAAYRQLEDYARQRAGAVKRHNHLPRGQVARLEGDHGYIDTTDGREIYFHHDSVLNVPFGSLTVGTPVKFTTAEGAVQPRATAVTAVGKRRR